MVDKGGSESEVEAMKAYRAAREETEDTDEGAANVVSSVLMDKVNILVSSWYNAIKKITDKFRNEICFPLFFMRVDGWGRRPILIKSGKKM